MPISAKKEKAKTLIAAITIAMVRKKPVSGASLDCTGAIVAIEPSPRSSIPRAGYRDFRRTQNRRSVCVAQLAILHHLIDRLGHIPALTIPRVALGREGDDDADIAEAGGREGLGEQAG